ncbi:hypothetical protein [Vibrio phage vB_pir03]|nr:hypothetical protein [Vibrio phage vB_pir03]
MKIRKLLKNKTQEKFNHLIDLGQNYDGMALYHGIRNAKHHESVLYWFRNHRKHHKVVLVKECSFLACDYAKTYYVCRIIGEHQGQPILLSTGEIRVYNDWVEHGNENYDPLLARRISKSKILSFAPKGYITVNDRKILTDFPAWQAEEAKRKEREAELTNWLNSTDTEL